MLNGGPHFTFSPAVSFFVIYETIQEIDEMWKLLEGGGTALIEIDKYQFSEKFGWLEDKYGISWQ